MLFQETPKEDRESVYACYGVCEVCASVGVRGGREQKERENGDGVLVCEQ